LVSNLSQYSFECEICRYVEYDKLVTAVFSVVELSEVDITSRCVGEAQ